jgi:DNA-binding MarR family transcriptional regulator
MGDKSAKLSRNNEEDIDMTVSTEQEKTVVRLLLLLSRTGDALNLCLDLVSSKYGISNEQARLLSVIKSRGPTRPVDIATLLERAPNSMSMLVDRMVKAGLVRRTRDRKDRRAVFVSLTNKGNEAVEPAIPAIWEFMNKLLSVVSYDEQRALADTLETLKCELYSYLNPEMDKAEIIKKSLTKDPNVYRRMLRMFVPAGCEPRFNRGEKGKTVGRK